MKRQEVIAIALGGLLALPAFANNEIDAGNLPEPVAATKSRAQVHDELLAAQDAGQTIVNAELGTLAADAARAPGKSRRQVIAETASAFDEGDMTANAELGTTYKDLYL